MNPGSSDRPSRSVRTVSQPTEPPRQDGYPVFIEAKDDGLDLVSGDNCSTGAISCAKLQK